MYVNIIVTEVVAGEDIQDTLKVALMIFTH